MKKEVKKCQIQTLGGGIRRAPIAFGLSAVLCMPAAFASANNNSLPAAQSVQTVSKGTTVKGKIIDENNEPLIGVSVILKGSTTGTITDIDGNFEIAGGSGKNVLEISYLGYLKQNVNAENNKFLNIKLEPDTKNLDEVVVIGYGTMKKRDLTGAVASVKSEDITMSPVMNPMQALQGRVAGLDITKSSGQAGATPDIQLRGNRSFTATGSPTFIIDGLPGDYNTLNPNDIQSIEVLKDASSTAIYGSGGANGVILITTKNGQPGKVNINFNAFVGFNGFATLPNMRSGNSYIDVLREARQIGGTYSDDENLFTSAAAYQAHLNGDYIDWADELMQTGSVQNYSFSASGGTDKTKAYFSLNFSDEKGMYTNDNYKVYSSKLRVDHKIRNWVTAGVDVQMSHVYQNRAYAKLINALTAVPLGSAYNEDGSVNINPVAGDGNFVNLLVNKDKSVYRNNNQNTRLYINPYIEFRPFKGFSYQTRISGSLNYTRNNYFQGIGSYQYYEKLGADAQGTSSDVYAQIRQNRGYGYTWENVVNYNFTINKDHEFALTAVTSWGHSQNDNTTMKQDNIEINSYLWHKMNSTNAYVNSSYSMSKGMGYVGRVNYSYKGKYLLSASVRHDGKSQLAPDHRWFTYPGVSAGWRISDENFMESTKSWMDNLKLRVGYGVTGLSRVDAYQSLATIDMSKFYTMGGELLNYYQFSQNMTNADLTWEKSYNTNIGVDASFFNGRIDLSADYYFTKTDDVIWNQNIPSVNGMFDASNTYTMLRNIAKTENNGIELTVNTRNIDTKNFKWNSTLTFTKNNEKIKKIIGGDVDHVLRSGSDYSLNIGHPINSYYKYKIDGIWQKGQETDAAAFGCEPGDIKINVPNLVKVSDGQYYKTDKTGAAITDGDGNIIYYNADNKYAYSGDDYQVIGSNVPKWTMGFQNTFVYKDFDLSIYAYFRYGQMIKYDMLGYYDPTGKGNFPTYFNYWTENNASNDFPALNSNREISSYTGYSDLAFVDGSFFKIKNITLGYTLPANTLRKAGISKCRFYATVENPFVFAKSHLLKDYDPEMNGSLNYPLTKQFVLGVNLSF